MQKQGEDRVSNRTRQNNKGADRRMESNDSPEVGGGHLKSQASIRATERVGERVMKRERGREE